MIRREKKHCLKTILGLALFACTLLAVPATTLPANAAVISDDAVAPCSDDIQWHYKIENNKLYKRLYNHTACCWLTDWIFVRDMSEDV